jgi:hypothetical protein
MKLMQQQQQQQQLDARGRKPRIAVEDLDYTK